MLDREYKVFYKAYAESPQYSKNGFLIHDVAMQTSRLYIDDRDIMNDTWYPNWVGVDDFIITLSRVVWSFGEYKARGEHVVRYTIYTTDRELVNRIYYNVKHGTNYWSII